MVIFIVIAIFTVVDLAEFDLGASLLAALIYIIYGVLAYLFCIVIKAFIDV